MCRILFRLCIQSILVCLWVSTMCENVDSLLCQCWYISTMRELVVHFCFIVSFQQIVVHLMNWILERKRNYKNIVSTHTHHVVTNLTNRPSLCEPNSRLPIESTLCVCIVSKMAQRQPMITTETNNTNMNDTEDDDENNDETKWTL